MMVIECAYVVGKIAHGSLKSYWGYAEFIHCIYLLTKHYVGYKNTDCSKEPSLEMIYCIYYILHHKTLEVKEKKQHLL